MRTSPIPVKTATAAVREARPMFGYHHACSGAVQYASHGLWRYLELPRERAYDTDREEIEEGSP
jgi:hypothetical protein